MITNIKIISVHYSLSESTEKFIQEKLAKLDYLESLITSGTFRIIRDNDKYKVEIDMHLKNKTRIHIQNTNIQLYPAIETCVHKLRHNLSEEHKRVKTHSHEVSHEQILNEITPPISDLV